MSEKDPFKDLAFSGAPSEYRLFRRKILLSVASLEEKHLYLAGPRILNRLQGEAWRATEHLSIGELRTEQGWLKVLRALDDHYRYLPETELNECVDEFLFHLKRRGNEGPTAFVSRFKAVLSRLESLVAAERAQQKGSTKRRRAADKHADSEAEQQSSSLSSDHAAEDDDEPRLTKDRVDQAAAASDPAKASPGPTTESKGPKTVGSFIDSPKGKKKPPSSGGGSHRSRGTHRADEERANRRMLEDLGKLEVGHLRVKPIFPEVILGHLFMRKYGLTREQRSQVIRSTGGSCKFKDVEKVIRASDYEDKMNDPGTRHAPPRQSRSTHVLAADEASSLSEPTYSEDEEIHEADGSFDEEGDEELEEAYEVQKRAKHEAKRAYRSYKDSRKKVREIKKERQPYMPVVALPPNASAPSDALPVQPTFKYDKKPPRRPGKDAKGGRKGRKEDINMVETEPLSEFLYMVSAVSEEKTSENEIVLEICSVTVSAGLAVIDTGCTTSVVGEDTARRYKIYFRERGLPEPQEVSLPPVQLKGFDGTRTSTSTGLRWTVKLGKLWGQVTTYSVPGQAPFLLSRKVLQGMEATLDLGKCTMTSAKHGIQDEPLMQAPNGHLLLPLVPSDGVEDLLQVREVPPRCVEQSLQSNKVLEKPKVDPREEKSSKSPKQTSEISDVDRKRHFQTVMKHTRYTQADVGTLRYQLRMLFGRDVDFALCGYRPRFERVPKPAATHHMLVRVAHLSPQGALELTPWNPRPPASRRAVFERPGACIFAYCYGDASQAPLPDESPVQNQGSEVEENLSVDKDPAVVPQESELKELPSSDIQEEIKSVESHQATCGTSARPLQDRCLCDCCTCDATEAAEPERESPADVVSTQDLEAMYEEVDWTTLEHLPLPTRSRRQIARQVEAVRRVPFQLALSSLREEPEAVDKELKEWLGPQAQALSLQRVGLVEVFSGRAPLSHHCEQIRGLASSRLGANHGQDFSRARDRRLLLLLLARTRPKDVWFSWPCECWSGWSRVNLAQGGSAARTVLAKRQKERPFLRLFEQTWSLQTMLGGHAHAENPVGSLAWHEITLGPAYEVDFDMCAVGLCDRRSGLPIRKPTRIVTSDPRLVESLEKCKCPGHAEHAHLTGHRHAQCSEVYPRKLCRRVASAFASRDKHVTPVHDIFLETDEEADSERESEPADEAEGNPAMQAANRRSYAAMIQKLHVNTGHASVPQMLRLAQRAKAPEGVVTAIRKFKCPVCDELQVPPSHRVAALRHTETPNHIVGIDVVQVELKRDTSSGIVEQKYNVLTAVDYATDFAQQIVLPTGPGVVSRAFHSLWCRPYGPPRVVYVDPDQRWMSGEFQEYLRQNSITLLDSATESHWQLGRVEIAQRILRNMAQRVWRTSERPAEEVIESCCGVRNEQLKRHGFSSAQWFLGREPRVPGSLADVTEQTNVATQDAVLSEQDFAQKMQIRQRAAEAFIEAHAHTAWTRAIRGRSRPMRGPYVVGQNVYVFRKHHRGQFSTRHGAWLGPGRVVGTESFRQDSPIPRVIWVVVNGFMYKCSPECLRPVAEDEVAFRQLAQQYHAGHLPAEMEQVTPSRRGPAGRFFDLTADPPGAEDFLTPPASDEEGGPSADNNLESDPPDRNVRRRITLSEEHWRERAATASPRGPAQVRLRDEPGPSEEGVELPADKAPRLEQEPELDPDLAEYSPSMPDSTMEDSVGVAPPSPVGPEASEPAAEEDLNHISTCCELAFDVFDVDLDSNGLGLWSALEECVAVTAKPGQKRRVEVSFRKLGPEDRAKFRSAMKKEWQSWLENKVTTVVKSRGIPKSRIIGSRWVLTWKKSSDPDDRSLSAKARLVLVGFQDPDLGRIATDSPTLRKERKHIIVSICASQGWVIWGADIKTAFLSGDASNVFQASR